MPIDKDGQRLRARIVEAIENQEEECAKESSRLKFVCSMKEDQIEEVFSYNEILDFQNNKKRILLNGNLKGLLHMKDYSTQIILTTMVLYAML